MTITDTVPRSERMWVNRSSALRVKAAADSTKIYKVLVGYLHRSIDSLDEQIRIKQLIIDEMNQQDSLQTQIILSYDQEIAVMKEQRGIFELQLKTDEKIIRKLKRKTFWVSVFGLAATGAAIGLGVLK